MKYMINWPKFRGWPWATIDDKGRVVGDRYSIGETNDAIILANIIDSMKRGIYTDAGYKVQAFQYEDNGWGWLRGKRKNVTTLGQQFAPKKARGDLKGLKPITEANRYKGKIDWEGERQQITNWLSEDLSRCQIAKRLRVSPSTLSEANKRHRLYPSRKRVA